VALVALYLLLGGPQASLPSGISRTDTSPALDDIDEQSRDAMRDLLRKAGSEE
jgi:hypothetical protein